MQRLLRTADWDVDGVRGDLRGYVVDQLGDSSGVWIVDDTGFIKKGVRSAGVARQYTGTSGKIDNCQLWVFLAYGSARGRALVDRELYLPTSWTEDADRCAAAAQYPRRGAGRRGAYRRRDAMAPAPLLPPSPRASMLVVSFWSHPSTFAYVHRHSNQCGNAGRER
jgi:hypothetical protein